MKEKLEYYRSLSTDEIIKLPMEQFNEYLSLLVEVHNKTFCKSLNDCESGDVSLNELNKAKWKYYISSLSDLSISYEWMLVCCLVDSPEIVESELCDFFLDLQNIYGAEIISRFLCNARDSSQTPRGYTG